MKTLTIIVITMVITVVGSLTWINYELDNMVARDNCGLSTAAACESLDTVMAQGR